jgi:hypothetical protein
MMMGHSSAASGYEGVMARQLLSVDRPGKRSSAWKNIKPGTPVLCQQFAGAPMARSERARLATRDQPEKGADVENGKGRRGNPKPKAEVRHHPGGRRCSKRPGGAMTLRFIEAHRNRGPVRLLCETLEVSPAGDFRHRFPCKKTPLFRRGYILNPGNTAANAGRA